MDALMAYGDLLLHRFLDSCDVFAPASLDTKAVLNQIATAQQSSVLDTSSLHSLALQISQAIELSQAKFDNHQRLAEPDTKDYRKDSFLTQGLRPPTERAFRVIFSHDVDHTSYLEPTQLVKTFLHFPKAGWRKTRDDLRCAPRVMRETVERMLAFELENNIRSIYFFLSGPYGPGRYGSRADIRWTSARGIVQSVLDAGMEPGLHGSYAARDRNSYRSEKLRMEEVSSTLIRHHRNHYLRHDPRRLAGQMKEAGLSYDHSIGFVNGFGFRTGTAVPYPLYDHVNQTVSDIIEVPMMLMDGSWYQGMSDKLYQELQDILSEVKQARGCVGINLHPEALVPGSNVWDLFKALVEICKDLGADMRCPGG